MTISKKRKRILCIAIPIAVIVIAAGVVLWLVLGQPESEKPFEVLRSQTTGEVVSCQLKDGVLQQTGGDTSQPYYTLTPPEGWTQIQQAQIPYPNGDADPDVFQSQDGTKMAFYQFHRHASLSIPDLSTLQEVQFGNFQVLYSQNTDTAWDGEQQVSRTTSLVYWVKQQTLFSLMCYQDLDVNQMLEWVSLVSYENPRMLAYEPPATEPLQLVRGAVQVTELEDGRTMSNIEYYRSEGNPEIPSSPAFFTFSQAPEGWTLVGKEENSYGSLLEKYLDEQGEILALTCTTGATQLFQQDAGTIQLYLPFSGMSRLELEDQSSVSDAQVNGNPAFVHINQDVSEIAWIDGYCTLQLRCTKPLSEAKLIALAEQVS